MFYYNITNQKWHWEIKALDKWCKRTLSLTNLPFEALCSLNLGRAYRDTLSWRGSSMLGTTTAHFIHWETAGGGDTHHIDLTNRLLDHSAGRNRSRGTCVRWIRQSAVIRGLIAGRLRENEEHLCPRQGIISFSWPSPHSPRFRGHLFCTKSERTISGKMLPTTVWG